MFANKFVFLVLSKFILAFVLFLHQSTHAQTKIQITLKGVVRDQTTGSTLPAATVYAPMIGQGVQCDLDGNFVLNLYVSPNISAADTLSLRFSMVGYESLIRPITLSQKPFLDIRLLPVQLAEIEISTEKTVAQKVRSTQMSLEQLTIKDAKNLPAIFGEVDILKTLQLKPGVQSGGEGSSGLYIRGGGSDQNLMLLDGATIYNASHLFGFFSIFNPDIVNKVDLYKGNFPAKYGGRLSSVVDVQTQEGSPEAFGVEGGIGLIASRLSIQGPISKKKPSSFILAARRTYFDVFTRQYNRINKNKADFDPIPDYYFYDLNAKINYTLSDNDKLSISVYYGNDEFSFGRDRFKFDFGWGNRSLATTWTHIFSDKLFVQSSLLYSSYKYQIRNSFENLVFSLGGSVQDLSAKTDFSYTPTGSRHKLGAGAVITRHDFELGRVSARSTDNSFNFSDGQKLDAMAFGAYLQDEITVSRRLEMNLGLRYSGFLRGTDVYHGLEPRAALRYMLDENTALKLGYARMFQYVHLVSNSGASLPTDLWYPSGRRVLPQISDQLALGFSKDLFNDGQFFLSNELYYKHMQRQTDFKDGANLFVNDKLDTTFVFGTGWAYGNEIYIEKKKGRTTGWIGYTLSWSWRRFMDIDQNQKFHPRQDRRHDISLVVMHKLNNRVSLSMSWVFGSGNAVTLPLNRYFFQDIGGTTASPPGFGIVPIYGNRNSFRMAAYHRLDFGLVYKLKTRYAQASDLTFSVYNAYNRMNPYFIYFETQTSLPQGQGNVTGFQARQVSLFPVIPTVTWNFKF